MTRLDGWLKQATRRLSQESVAQVRAEIQEHYESAREAAMIAGAAAEVTPEMTADEADRRAVADLGDAGAANCRYRKVLLTAAEARLLREGNWEARAICSRAWMKRTLVILPLAALIAATIAFLLGAIEVARILMVPGLGMGSLFAVPMFPVYTPARSRIYRVVKWAVMIGMFALAFGADTLKWSWLLICCLWPVFQVEWTRASIRRKLQVEEWPRQLYL
jgi:hypothetical protein